MSIISLSSDFAELVLKVKSPNHNNPMIFFRDLQMSAGALIETMRHTREAIFS